MVGGADPTRRADRDQLYARPLTLTLSPEYGGEGTGGRPPDRSPLARSLPRIPPFLVHYSAFGISPMFLRKLVISNVLARRVRSGADGRGRRAVGQPRRLGHHRVRVGARGGVASTSSRPWGRSTRR